MAQEEPNLDQLIQAIESKNQDLALSLIEQINDPDKFREETDQTNQNGKRLYKKSALHLAVAHGLLDVVNLLRKKGLKLNYYDADGKFPHQLAFEPWNIEAIKYFDLVFTIDKHSDEPTNRYPHEIYYYDYWDQELDFRFHLTIQLSIRNNLTEFKQFYEHHVFTDISYNHNENDRTIDCMVRYAGLELLDYMIAQDPRCLDEALHDNLLIYPPTLMKNSPNLEVVKFLISKGYKFYARSVVDLIGKFGTEGLNILKLHNIDLNMLDDNSETPLQSSIKIYEERFIHDELENKLSILKAQMMLIAHGVKVDFSDSETLKYFIENWGTILEHAFFDEYGLPALNNVLKAAMEHQKSGRKDIYDGLSKAFRQAAHKHIDMLHDKNFKYIKGVKTIPEEYENIKAAHKGSSSVPEISEKAQPREYHIFKALKEVHKEKLDILTQDKKILIKGAGLYIANPNIKGETPERTTEKAKKVAVKANEAFNTVDAHIIEFLTAQEQGELNSMVVPLIYFDIASTQIVEQQEANLGAKRAKLLGDCYIETVNKNI